MVFMIIILRQHTEEENPLSGFVTRFAPSPTGLLHLGHAYSALCAYAHARNNGGRFLLRIEDIDQSRCKPEFEDAIFEDLRWLGLEWETPVRRQSDHFADYNKALQILREKGVVYRCFKTRKEIAEAIASAPHLPASGPEGPQYIGKPLRRDQELERITRGDPFAWRLSMSKSREYLGPAIETLSFMETGRGPNGESGDIKARPEIFGDAVIARKDAGTSYHMAAVHDDALQGITHVVRGCDLFHASHLHALLFALLDLPQPAYCHHRLITNDDGKRFAKRDAGATIRQFRESGGRREDLIAKLGLG